MVLSARRNGMDIKPGSVVLCVVRRGNLVSWQEQIGCVQGFYKECQDIFSVRFPRKLKEGRKSFIDLPLREHDFIKLFQITEQCTGWQDVNAIAEIYKNEIIEGLINVLIEKTGNSHRVSA